MADSSTPKRGKARLTPADREARQGLMLVQKLTGKYVPEIAAAFGVSEGVVYRELAEAQRKQLHGKAVSFISLNLMPKALAVYAAALDQGNTEIATKVLEGLGILGQRGNPGLIAVTVGGDGHSEETFEAWRMRISRVATGRAPAGESPAAPRLAAGGGAVDGEVVAEGGAEGLGAGTSDPSVEGT